MSLLQDNNQSIDKTRREFLRKSVYAAYATPVIVTLLVAKKSAAGSVNPGQCAKEGKIVSPDGTQCIFPSTP